MPIIRFVREGRDVKCQFGENLREVALREGLELYGFKGKLGNCGGYGQCITCYVSVAEGQQDSLSPITDIEQTKLRGRPGNWRLACQAVVKTSAIVLTKPQSPPANVESLMDEALSKDLPK
ncbi:MULTISPECIES: 2Fe-2S iron-sulfur cluster-binding protein [Prochlorococcus]|nr:MULTISPECIES: 2Fe-2S iron-sulfur cluster-binding protein [Prochlorococcus]KGG11328.1 Ferredoxin [Prochlorococcus marinus str. LG]KGG34094.1 Ferredoxin [Prochlorococcus marinus str. SS51]KGG37549.1 Ferredoxin [Prochlorococcus sp. SS52]